MKKILIMAALALTSLVSNANEAREVKSYYVPYAPNQNVIKGSFLQDNKGGFVCVGKNSVPDRDLLFIPNIQGTCEGEKLSFQQFVKTKLNSKYIGSTFVYKDISLRMADQGIS